MVVILEFIDAIFQNVINFILLFDKKLDKLKSNKNELQDNVNVMKKLFHYMIALYCCWWYLPLHNGVAFPFFPALVFRNPVSSYKIKIKLILVSRHR